MQDGDAGTAEARRVWLVVGEKRGDNAQVRNLARAAGLAEGDVVEKSIVVRPEWSQDKPHVTASLDHVDRAQSDALEGPWPDLVITAGRRLSSVALWVKQASGGRSRVVVVGKPRGSAADFDLIVAASHYEMPATPNVVRHAYPLMEVDGDALAQAEQAWTARLADVARPLTAVLVGGPTGGLRFGAAEADTLVRHARRFTEAHGGSLHIVTSRRTPASVVDRLREATRDDPAASLSVYDPTRDSIDSPYRGLLAVADHFVVTTDSLSMMVEVAQLGRPVSLFPLTRAVTPVERVLERIGLLQPIDPTRDAIPAGGVWRRTLAALGRPIHSRDLTATARRLVADGLAAWSRDPMPTAAVWRDEELEHVVTRVRALARSADVGP